MPLQEMVENTSDAKEIMNFAQFNLNIITLFSTGVKILP